IVERTMSRQYSPQAFLRQVPNALLKLFFERRNHLTHLHWYLYRETETNLIYRAWMDLPENEREAVESAFRDIHEMACEPGIQALIEEGRVLQKDLAQALHGLHGLHHKAMWAFLHHEDVFRRAFPFNHAQTLPQRYWNKRKNVPRKTPNV